MEKTTITINHLYTTPTYTAYDVICFNNQVRTIVTSSPNIVTSWLTHITKTHENTDLTVVGLDTEWLNPVATLQLCVGPNCLIYQLLYSPMIPTSVRDFLGDPRWRFCGVGVVGDAKRLVDDYELVVANVADVSRAAAEEKRVRVNAGLREVARVVLGWEIEKCKDVTLSMWDSEVLDNCQVKYACVSYMIGKVLFDHHGHGGGGGGGNDTGGDGGGRFDCGVLRN